MNMLSSLPHWINREFMAKREKHAFGNLLKSKGFCLSSLGQVSSISFAQNCVALFKINGRDEEYINRHYKFSLRVQRSLLEHVKDATPDLIISFLKKTLGWVHY